MRAPASTLFTAFILVFLLVPVAHAAGIEAVGKLSVFGGAEKEHDLVAGARGGGQFSELSP